MDYRKKLLYETNSGIVTITVLGILILLNIISARNFGRIDLTSDKRYSVSEDTKRVLADLKDTVDIKVYFSEENLPPNLLMLPQFTRDILEEYKSYAKGNLLFRFFDPSKDEKYAIEARNTGIPDVRLNVTSKDKLDIQTVYFGMGIFFRDKKEVIPLINVNTLEYDLTATIKKVTADMQKSVGFLTGHSEYSLTPLDGKKSDYSQIIELLEKNYTVKEVDVTKGNKISDIDTLIIAGPKKNLSERELFEIDQFRIQGGTVIFLVDDYAIDYGLTASKVETNVKRLLESYGISTEAGLILDRSHTNASFQQGITRYILPYPFWIAIQKDFIDSKNPAMSNLDSLILPWSTALKIEKKEAVKIEELARTTSYAWLTNGVPNLDPVQNFEVQQDKLKQYPVVILVRSKFKSLFDKIPAVDNASAVSNDKDLEISTPNDKPNQDIDRQVIAESSKEGAFAVIGSSQLINNIFIQQFEQNGVFFLNLVDYLTLDSSLINIRSKGLEDRPLKETSATTKTLFKVMGILGMPMVNIVLGVTRNFQRRRKKKLTVVF